LKVLIFTVSAMLAGLGGALLAQQKVAFDPTSDFDPLGNSLPWFTVVVVFGADSAAAAVAGAGLVVLVNAVAGQAGAYLIIVGLLASFLGRLPGGVAELSRRIVEWVLTPRALIRRYLADTAPRPAPVLSPQGRAALERLRAARAERS